MLPNQTSTSPWKTGLYFNQGMSSGSLKYFISPTTAGEGQLRRTNESLPTQTMEELSLQKNYVKTRNNVGNTSTQQFHRQKSAATRKNVIILSPGRGGSSFLGGIFDSSPHVMYWFEPLHTVISELFNSEIQLFFEGKEPKNYSETSIRVINSLFDCDFSNMSNATLSAFSSSMFRKRSKALSSGYFCPKKCVPFSKPLLSKACNSYSHTVIKLLTIRVPNKTIQGLEALFKQPERYDVKLVHLVRDPRAVVHSMVNSAKWINNHLDPNFRGNVHRICNLMLENLRFGLSSPPSWLKNRFKVIRYEDLVLDTIGMAQELYRFAGFDWSTSVDEWINRHENEASKAAAKNPYSLHRNASAVIDKWKNAPEAFIRTVEDVCGDLMILLGYKMWTKRDRQTQ